MVVAMLAACGSGTGGSNPDSGEAGVRDSGGGGDTMIATDTPSTETMPPADEGMPDVQTPPDVVAADENLADTSAPVDTGAPDEAAPDVVTPDVVTPDVPVMDAPVDDVVDAAMPMGETGTPTGDASTDTGMNMCMAGSVSCGGGTECIDLMTDTANCGRCGNACTGGQFCTAGVCGCAMGRMSCGGACVDPRSDNANCGMCGRACPMGQTCEDGACACPTGETSCGTGSAATCVNTASDNANCGACGNACPAGRSCSMGACVCPMGQTSCGTGATATCVTTASDNNNCGACGTTCTGGATCVMGACTCATGQTRCGTGPMAACTDTQTDTANCGACGTACPTGQVCTMGACRTTCTAPNVACGTGAAMACANTQNDDQNCGACGTVCGTVPNSFGGLCNAGSCRPICTSGFGNCNTTYADGCEVNLTNNLSNCGACGNTCPTTAANATGVTCGSSRCTPTCNAPTATEQFADCNSSVADGCERNLMNDPNNCGSCGNVCPGGGMCFAGRCASTSCRDLHAAAPTLPSGLYPIDPDGAGPLPPVTTYCDMTTRGGGWTLVQRSVIDWRMSDMLRTTLAVFRDNTIGNPASGNFFRMAARNWPLLQSTNEHMIVHTPARSDGSSCTPLQYIAPAGRWNVPATGNITLTGAVEPGGGVSFWHGQGAAGITTTDVKNDMSPSNSGSCVNGHQAAPWFYTYCCSTCFTFGGGYWGGFPANPPRPMANYLGVNDINGRNVTSACAGNPSPVQISSGYYGETSMEYFIR